MHYFFRKKKHCIGKYKISLASMAQKFYILALWKLIKFQYDSWLVLPIKTPDGSFLGVWSVCKNTNISPSLLRIPWKLYILGNQLESWEVSYTEFPGTPSTAYKVLDRLCTGSKRVPCIQVFPNRESSRSRICFPDSKESQLIFRFQNS